MRLKLLLAVLTLWMPSAAPACRVATQMHDPSHSPSDVIVEGIASAPAIDGVSFYSDVRVTKSWLGNERPHTVRLSWSQGAGTCAPPGPIPTDQSRLMLYLVERDGKLATQGWLAITDRPDRRMIADTNKKAQVRVMLPPVR